MQTTEPRPRLDTLPPEMGDPLPPRSSGQTLELLATRRSSAPQSLTAPAPTGDALRDLIRLAVRVPDHGKMTPWRLLVFEGEAKSDFVARLTPLAAASANPGKARAALTKLAAPPLAIAVISAPRLGAKAVWEQVSSAAAVCTLMLVAAEAMGYGASWISEWYAEDPVVLDLLGVDRVAPVPESVAGWIMIGTPSEPPLERVRPDFDAVTRFWRAPAP